MTKFVIITDQKARKEMAVFEMLFGEGKTLSFEGPLLAVDPTPEELAELDSNFKEIYESGRFEDMEVVDGVVYYDTGAKRGYVIDEDEVNIEEVE